MARERRNARYLDDIALPVELSVTDDLSAAIAGADDVVVSVPSHSFREMLEAVKAGEADYAVRPIENSSAGSINDSYDLLAATGLSLVGEEFQPIAHCLIGAADVAVTDIRRVFSHPVALAQCGEFLETLEDCHVEAFVDTAMAEEASMQCGPMDGTDRKSVG